MGLCYIHVVFVVVVVLIMVFVSSVLILLPHSLPRSGHGSSNGGWWIVFVFLECYVTRFPTALNSIRKRKLFSLLWDFPCFTCIPCSVEFILRQSM